MFFLAFDGHKMCQLVQDSTECKTCGTDRPLLLHLLLAAGDDGSPVCPRSDKHYGAKPFQHL